MTLEASIERLRLAMMAEALIAVKGFQYGGSIADDLAAVLGAFAVAREEIVRGAAQFLKPSEQAAEAPAIPFLDGWRLAIAALGPEDVLVLSCPGALSLRRQEQIRDQLVAVFPGRKVIILADGLELSIVAPSGEVHP